MKVPQRLQRYLSAAFSIDLRALALFRAALGAVLCATLLLRFCDLGAFQSDDGVLPRAWLLQSAGPLPWSLHFAGGSTLFQGALLAAQALLAFCLAVGHRTRLAVVLSWFLLLSLHGRNPLVLTGADGLMAALLFWAMFLPLAARWSVDAALSTAPPPEGAALSWASAGLVLQVLALLLLALQGDLASLDSGFLPCIGLVAVAALVRGAWWDALARRLDHGRHLKIYYDESCAFCLKSCLLLRHLLALPRTELLPAQGSTRAHALMQAQNSWVVIDGEDVAHTKWNAFVALLRHSLLFGWAWRLAALRLWERPGNAVYDCVARHRGALGRVTAVLLPQREVRFGVPAWTQAAAAVVLALALAWNLASAQWLPDAAGRVLATVLRPIGMDLARDALAPRPGRRDGWFIAPGQLGDGTAVDVLRPDQRGVDYARPARDRDARGSMRWRAYFAHFDEAGFRHQAFAGYLCRQWAASGRPLARFRLIFMLEAARPDGTPAPVEQLVLWQHDCAAP
jgi:predicted DCC family thiol-disulfide oxidoreductase YuxK